MHGAGRLARPAAGRGRRQRGGAQGLRGAGSRAGAVARKNGGFNVNR